MCKIPNNLIPLCWSKRNDGMDKSMYKSAAKLAGPTIFPRNHFMEGSSKVSAHGECGDVIDERPGK